jgi:hypothetical protein
MKKFTVKFFQYHALPNIKLNAVDSQTATVFQQRMGCEIIEPVGNKV